MARRIAQHPEVKWVLERLERDRLAVFVILDDDPESLLNEIFEAERELYSTFHGLPFDVRVMRPSAAWSPDSILQDTIAHYERPTFHAASK
jgi:hypothetical protein